MDNANVGNGNISKKIGYSITDEQLQIIATEVIRILDTISNNKADKDLSNVDDKVFEAKAKSAGVGGGSGGGAVSSVNEKTGDVNLTASDVGAYTKAETKQFVENSINESHAHVILPAINSKADANLSNVTDEAFLTKLNMVLPDGDEVSY